MGAIGTAGLSWLSTFRLCIGNDKSYTSQSYIATWRDLTFVFKNLLTPVGSDEADCMFLTCCSQNINTMGNNHKWEINLKVVLNREYHGKRHLVTTPEEILGKTV